MAAASSALRGITRRFSTRAPLAGSAGGALGERLSEGLKEMRDAGTYKVERVIVTPQSTTVRVQGRKDPVDVFCANNVSGAPAKGGCRVLRRRLPRRSTWGSPATQR